MAGALSPLTQQEYERLCGHESGWEYRSGAAYRKPVPTRLHGLLAALLADLLRLAGYISSVEVEVRLTPDWSPRPDVLGELQGGDEKYPRSVDVVCEVLSEGEDILPKCRDYWATGRVGQIFVFEIERKTIQTWDGSALIPSDNLLLGNGVTITAGRIWRELEEKRRSQPPTAMLLD